MRFELPHLKRCCFCLPLRYGLIGWTYFKLKNVKLLRLYFYFSIVALAFIVVLYIMEVSIVLSGSWNLVVDHYGFQYTMACFSVYFIYVVICIYTILLTRSEIKKLENDCEVKFVNHAAEAECIMSICQDLEHDDKTAADDVTV